MSNFKKIFCALLTCTMLALPLWGCGEKEGSSGSSHSGSAVVQEESSSEADETESSELQSEESPVDSSQESDTSSSAEEEAPSFDYSADLTADGYWEGITALDYVTLGDYSAITVPADKHTVTDEELQARIDEILAQYPKQLEIKDRAIEDGDQVNIDYVGSVDGVEFEGGNSGGTGAQVTAGSTEFIDDFLTQIIGHTPGETFDVEVTFPEEYQEESLAGKDAVFVTTINYIFGEEPAELTDDFVAETFPDSGTATVEEFRNDLSEELKENKINTFLEDYLVENCTVTDLPDLIYDHIESSMIFYYEQNAGYYGMDLDALLNAYMDLDGVDALKEFYQDQNLRQSNLYLITQAIAEDMDYVPTDEDAKEYFSEEYDSYIENFGDPYVKQIALYRHVMDLLHGTITLA